MATGIQFARDWAEARRILSELAFGLPISFGTGNPISYPHVRALYLNADAGEGFGYRVYVRYLGDGYMNPADHYLIYVCDSRQRSICNMPSTSGNQQGHPFLIAEPIQLYFANHCKQRQWIA